MDFLGVIKGDTRSLDYSSNSALLDRPCSIGLPFRAQGNLDPGP